MSHFLVEGQAKLRGEIVPKGAKNEALQVICATLLTSKKVLLHNLPNILDVSYLIDLLKILGVKVSPLNKARTSYSFEAVDVDIKKMKDNEFLRKASTIRGSVMLAGALLGRCGEAYIAKPGGDKIGRRKIDTHFGGFEKLGVCRNSTKKEETYALTVPKGKLQGSYILLDEASITGTANLIMAAACAEGKTIIYNAACEPYVQQLCRMLNRMGANIEGIASNLLTIRGVDTLCGCEHTLLPDMIEVGSFIGMAAMTSSELTIKNVAYDELGILPDAFLRFGIELQQREDDIVIPEQDSYKIGTFLDGSVMTIADAPWPGISPDLLSIFLVIATQADGCCLIHQKMFESRLFFVDKLIDMGAQIILCDPHRAIVIGHNKRKSLKGKFLVSPDIRAGAALLIAAISAEGESTIANIEQLDRGYDRIDERLRAIGAKITRVERED